MIKMNKILLIILALNLGSCRIFFDGMPTNWEWGFGTTPLTGTRNFPSADTPYGQGFRDGCKSGLKAVSKGFLADSHNGVYDYRRFKKSADYNTGWWDGFEQCTYILDNAVV